MPQGLVLIVPRTWTAESMSSLFEGGAYRLFPGDGAHGFQIQDLAGESYFDIGAFTTSTHEEITEEYAANEDLDPGFRDELGANKEYYAVMFRGIDFAREILQILAERGPTEIWIDTEYGWVIRGDQFLSRVRREPNWDWRHDRSVE